MRDQVTGVDGLRQCRLVSCMLYERISHAKMLHVSEISGRCSSDWVNMGFSGDGFAVYAMDTFPWESFIIAN